MNRGRMLLVSLGVTLAVWLVFSWPLPAHLFAGVPVSSRNVEAGAVRAMMPGDQLQLIYHFRLFKDMLAGETPWLHNLYEFNVGDDDARFWPSAYFFPFSLVFAAGSAVAGDAFGINLAGFIALWLTLFFTWRLLARHVPGVGAAFTAALISVLVPYRWAMLLGGSPTGYAMVYVPVLALGIDILVRERRWTGGLIAGMAMLLVCFGDVQLFAFCGLSLPLWGLWSLLATQDPLPRLRKDLTAWTAAAAPLLVGIGLAFAYRWLLQPHIGRSTMGGGRDPAEIALFSPAWTGFFSWANQGVNNHVYIGFIVPAVLALGLAGLAGRERRSAPGVSRHAWPLLLAAGGALGVCLFALGPLGPADGLVFRAVRKAVPAMNLLRQPAKAFGLMPTLLAAGLGGGVAVLTAWCPERSRRLVVLVSVLIAAEYRSQVRATVNLVDPSQAAYAAVAGHARGRGAEPRALILPLWPGDSDLASIYQYWVGRYRIRMVNGYSPVIAQDYFEDVFRRFESANQGFLDDGQLDRLADMGVGYLLLHEDLFPEKVSPFPVTATLQRLLDHPRLDLLRGHQTVWAFRLLAAGEDKASPVRAGESFFPTRRYEMERGAQARGGTVWPGGGASGPGFVRLDGDAQWVAAPPTRAGPAPRLRWAVRARGRGTLQAICRLQDEAPFRQDLLAIDAANWTWQEIPLDGLDRFGPLELELHWADGTVDLDLACLQAGQWDPIQPGHQRTIAAAALFHAGYSEPGSGRVFFRRRYEPDQAILYGPELPLDPGDYQVELRCTGTPVPIGRLQSPNLHVAGRPVEIIPGHPTVASFTVASNLPVRFEFVYNRAADLAVDSLRITRIR